MMLIIVENPRVYPLKNQKILLSNKIVYIAYLYEKFLVKNFLFLILVMNLYHFYKELKKIYMDQSIHIMDRFINL